MTEPEQIDRLEALIRVIQEGLDGTNPLAATFDLDDLALLKNEITRLRDLFRRYVLHIIAEESVDYLWDNIGNPFSAEEVAEIRAISGVESGANDIDEDRE